MMGISRNGTEWTFESIPYQGNGKVSVWRKAKEKVCSLLWDAIISPASLATSFFTFTLVPEEVIKEGPYTAAKRALRRFIKRSIDIVVSVLGLIVLSPLFALISFLIKLDSEGPVFYVQERIGQNRRKGQRRRVPVKVPFERRNGDRRKKDLYGRPFYLYKFRTMRVDAEKNGPVWASKDDPRVTRMGRILRMTHLDELPQLVNVLKGEMSLVGPRPERPYFVERLASLLPDYTERLSVKPGITGLAQVHCGYDRSVEDVKRKLKYDLEYVRNGTLLSELKIMALTLGKLLTNGKDF